MGDAVKIAALAAAVLAFAGQLPRGSASEPAINPARTISRLAPSAFTDVPADVRDELTRRGCSIPQTTGRRAANVIRGDFYGNRQADWAALCSRNQRSSILVFRNGRAAAVEELASSPDEQYVQEAEPGRFRFSRSIGVASPSFILDHYHWYGGVRPPRLSHSGVEDAFVEKASIVWFWDDGHWLRLTGAD